MIDYRIFNELERVRLRYRKLALRSGLAVCWAAVAVAGLLLLALARGAGYAIPGIAWLALAAAPLLAVPWMIRSIRRTQNPNWLAHRIEKEFPNLDSRLLAALEQKPDSEARYSYLQQTVIEQAVDHAHLHGWGKIVPSSRLRVAGLGHWAMLLAMGTVLFVVFNDMRRRPSTGGWLLGGVVDAGLKLKIEPEDTSIERGTGLLVLARFGENLPSDVQLLARDPEGNVQQMQMSKSLDDPVFAARIPSVNQNLTYAVRYGEEQTRWYGVEVFEFPELKQIDANLKFPEYTGLAEKVVQDTRSVTAVEGTKASFTFRLNKAVAQAKLTPRVRSSQAAAPATAPATQPVELVVDPADPTRYTMTVDLKQSQRFELSLVDDKGRTSKRPPELAINVTANKPPTLKLTWPSGDVDVSPLEELSLGAQVSDDFGVQRVGVSYAMAGKPPEAVVLGEKLAPNQKKDVTQLVSFEKFNAEPDELMSYHFWVEDFGPDGKIRRTASDIFFAEVRPFEQIFRQGQQPTQGEQEQQQQRERQQQQGQQGSQNAQDAEQLADLQKEIIAATWKVIRREVQPQPTAEFVPDVKTIGESQTSAREQAAAMDERLTDERSKAYLQSALKNMDSATSKLNGAGESKNPGALAEALSVEQAAYQDLLKLRAREFEVVRQNRQQRGQQQQQARSGAQNRRQRQMNQLDLANQDNRYETQRNAATPQEQDPQQREDRQVLSRLRELAQRQEDLNRQMQELNSALQQAQTQQQREELERQLARLRDQQQQQLRDADELRDRMDQPQNQEQMADSRQQLEQTREDLRRASESLERQQAGEAAAAGARAAEELNQLRDQFRRNTSGQFAEAVNEMRQQARELDETQRDLSQRMNGLNEAGQAEQRTLRDGGDRQEIVNRLGQQREQLDQLLDNMRQTIEESEVPEPLLSRGLYEAVRQAGQRQTNQALDMSRQLLDRGFVDQARQAERDAGSGIAQLRDGIEQAAESVLGGQTEALTRAREELDRLSGQLDREIARNQPPTTRPGAGQLAQAGRGGRQPTSRPDGAQQGDGQQPGDQQAQAGEQSGEQPGRGQQPGQAGRAGRGNQRGGRGEQNPELADAGQQRGGRSGRGQQPGGEQPGQEPGDQQAQGGQQPNGQQPGGEQPGDEQGRGQQPGGQARGQQPGGQQPGAQARGQQPGGQQPGGQQPGQRGRGGRDGRGGEPQDGQANQGGLRPGGRQGGREGGRGGQGGEFQDLLGGARAGNEQPQNDNIGPIAGDGFRDWADRLRDVEEMVDDPGLRARAAQIRDRARDFRVDRSRTGVAPNWELVQQSVAQPLVELRNAVTDELLRRQSSQALVPIDREPVPPEYAEKVRRYYESLGGGR